MNALRLFLPILPILPKLKNPHSTHAYTCCILLRGVAFCCIVLHGQFLSNHNIWYAKAILTTISSLACRLQCNRVSAFHFTTPIGDTMYSLEYTADQQQQTEQAYHISRARCIAQYIGVCVTVRLGATYCGYFDGNGNWYDAYRTNRPTLRQFVRSR